MEPSRPRAATRLVLCAIALAAAAPVQADALSDRIATERIVRQRNIDVDIARSQQRRENFATEQRMLREIDRMGGRQPRMRLDVPRVQPGCQIQIRGNTAIGRPCR